MANTLRIKRRLSTDDNTTVIQNTDVQNAELAYNEHNDILYIGRGVDGDNSANAFAIGGPGAFVALGNTNQTIDGTKTFSNDIVFSSGQLFDGRDVSADGTKLDGIESGATADQTAAEIRTLVENASDSNVFTDDDHTKLDGIEAGADVTDTANVTSAGALMDSEVTNLQQVKDFDSSDYATAAQGALADSAQQPPSEGAFVDGDKTKLDGIEAGATADQTAAEIRSLVGSASDSNVFTDADHTKLDGIEDSANNYSLPEATSTTRGGIELFSDTDQTVAANSVSSTANRTYGIQLNSNGQAVVNVPWSDTTTDVDVSKANLITRLGEFNSSDTVYIGDADNDTTVSIRGNLNVAGTTTTVNSTNIDVADATFTIASDTSGDANLGTAGAGIHIGADDEVTFTYDGTDMNLNKPLTINGALDGATIDGGTF